MSNQRRVRGPLLLVVGVALVAVTLLILVSLRRSSEHAASTEEAASPAAPPASRPTAGPAVASRLRRPANRDPRQAARQATTAAGRWQAAGLPHFQRSPASRPLPPEIQNETDPAKKQELIKMHELSTARVRVTALHRRAETLESSIAEARQKGTWPADRIQAAERQLAEIRGVSGRAEEHFEQLRKEYGGDIDKGKR